MPLSDADKERARYHLGFLAVQPAASISYGIPKPIQTLFLVEVAMNNLLEAAVPRVLRVLGILDGVETKLVEAQDRLAADALGDLKLRKEETDMLEAEYRRWGFRLADILGVPVYAFSNRYKGGGVRAGNVPVR
jgi:hypothetical protein